MPDEQVTKGHICNRLIARFGLSTYLEYNKFDGITNFSAINCAQKALAFIPEECVLDAAKIAYLLDTMKVHHSEQIFHLPQLLERYRDQRFDVILFDPVHQRPGVDEALKALPFLLNPGGFLVVHDCNPQHEHLTWATRTEREWLGETFKAFALFRQHNPKQSFCIAEDYGVGVIVNRDLELDYDENYDIEFSTVAADRKKFLGLMDFEEFIERSESGQYSDLLRDLPTSDQAAFSLMETLETDPKLLKLQQEFLLQARHVSELQATIQHERVLYQKKNQEFEVKCDHVALLVAEADGLKVHITRMQKELSNSPKLPPIAAQPTDAASVQMLKQSELQKGLHFIANAIVAKQSKRQDFLR